MRRKADIFRALLIPAMLVDASVAATKTWDHGATTANWADAANWDADGVPAAGDTVNFTTSGNTPGSINLNSSYPDGGSAINLGFAYGKDLTIGQTSGNSELYVNALTVSDAFNYTLDVQSGTGGNSGTMAQASANWNIGTGGKLTVLSRWGAKSGVTTGSITKTGEGVLVFGGGITTNAISQYLWLDAQAGLTELGFTGGGPACNGISRIMSGATVKITSSYALQTILQSSNYSRQSGVTSLDGTFDLNGFNQTITSLASTTTSGLVTNGGTADSVLTIGLEGITARTEFSAIYGGVLSDGATNKLGLTLNAKSATFVQTLTGYNTYSGATTLTKGTLRLNGGSIANSAMTMNNATTLTIGNGTTIKTAEIGSVTMNGTSTIKFDLTSGDCDRIDTGNFTYSGGSMTVDILSQPPVPSSYTLVNYTGTRTGTPPVTINGLTGSTVATIDYGTGANSSITVNFNLPPAQDLTWNGNISGVWDVATTANWLNGATSSTYALTDKATFTDSATGTTSIVLNTSVAPLEVTFSNSAKTYSLTGTGSINGGATMLLSNAAGGGAVIIATDNSYSGGTEIQTGCSLQVGNGGGTGSLGSGAIFNEGSLAINRTGTLVLGSALSGAGSLQQSGAGTTVLAADNSYTGPTTISGGILQIGNGGATGSLGATSTITNNATLAFNLSGDLTIPQVITGTGALAQNGTGTVVLAENMTYGGGTTINSGTLRLGSNGVVGSVPGAITTNGTLSISRSDDINFSNTVTGTGGIEHAGSGQLRLTGPNSYAGITSVFGGGTLVLDSTGSAIPAGTGIAIASGTLDFTDTDLTVSSLTKTAFTSGIATVTANPGKTLTVQGGGNVLINQGTLSLTGIASFAFDNASGGFSAFNTVSGSSVTAYLPQTTTITCASFTVGQGGPSGQNSVSNAAVHLGQTNTLHADSFAIGDNSAQSGTSTLRIASGQPGATVEIRAADGTGRADLVVGSKGTASDYSGGSGVVNLTETGSTLDALLGSVVIGRHGGGAGNFDYSTSGSFAFNAGILDATSITMGVGQSPDKKTASGTLTTNGGTIRVVSLTLVQDSGGPMGTATVNLNAAGVLEATTIAGQEAANATINWNQGTVKPIAGADLAVTHTTLSLPADSNSRTLATGSDKAALSTGSVIKPAFDSSAATPVMGSFTLTGDLTLAGASLAPVDLALTSLPLPDSTKFTLIDYTGAMLSGTFTGLADGDSLVVGVNTFVIDYDDNGGTAVTLTASNSFTPYQSWAIAKGIPGASFNADNDGDGVANGLEWILEGNPVSQDAAALVTTSANASGLTLRFNREETSIGQATLGVEYDADLAGPWTSFDIGAVSSTEANGVTVTIDTDATPDRVTVFIPVSPNAPAGQIFGRLKATQP